MTAQSTHAAVFSSEFLDNTLTSWALFNNSINAALPRVFDSELITFVGKIVVASIAALMGLVLIVRVVITRAIESLMDG
jgi:hypothetical protein